MASLQNITRLFGYFPPKSTQEAFLFYGGRGFRQQGFLRWKNYTWLEGKNRFMSFRINSAIYWYICQWTKLVGCNCRPLVRTCCMPCQLRSVPSNLGRANALKKRRAAPALWTLAKIYFVSRTFCSHLLNWCSFSTKKINILYGMHLFMIFEYIPCKHQ